MKHTLLIIPGFGESTSEVAYKSLISKYRTDFDIVAFEPKWEYQTASRWVEDLSKILSTIDVRNTTVISFSLGAYITLIAAETYAFQKIILCSLSPFFKEQLHNMPKSAQAILGKKRMLDFSTRTIPKTIACPAIFLFGENDWPIGINEAKKLSQKYSAHFELIKDAPHELTVEYMKKIASFIK